MSENITTTSRVREPRVTATLLRAAPSVAAALTEVTILATSTGNEVALDGLSSAGGFAAGALAGAIRVRARGCEAQTTGRGRLGRLAAAAGGMLIGGVARFATGDGFGGAVLGAAEGGAAAYVGYDIQTSAENLANAIEYVDHSHTGPAASQVPPVPQVGAR